MKTTTKSFEIILPPTPSRPARHAETLMVEVFVSGGEEFLTQESRLRIDRAYAHHLGLLTGEDIKALRERLGLTQNQLADLLQCGKKSLSRWENDTDGPSRIINALLRLLDEERVSLEDLRAVQLPRPPVIDNIVRFINRRSNAPATYDLTAAWRSGGHDVSEPLAM